MYIFINGFAFLFEEMGFLWKKNFSNFLVIDFLPQNFSKLVEIIKNKKVIICGWSLGGKWAIKLLKSYPEIVLKIYLLNQRPIWKKIIPIQIKKIKEIGKENYLKDFYKNVFRGNKEEYKIFKTCEKNLIKKYNLTTLLWQLRELENFNLEEEIKNLNRNITFIHTRFDAIAPLSEINEFCKKNNYPLKIIKKLSHFPFNSEELWTILR